MDCSTCRILSRKNRDNLVSFHILKCCVEGIVLTKNSEKRLMWKECLCEINLENIKWDISVFSNILLLASLPAHFEVIDFLCRCDVMNIINDFIPQLFTLNLCEDFVSYEYLAFANMTLLPKLSLVAQQTLINFANTIIHMVCSDITLLSKSDSGVEFHQMECCFAILENMKKVFNSSCVSCSDLIFVQFMPPHFVHMGNLSMTWERHTPPPPT